MFCIVYQGVLREKQFDNTVVMGFFLLHAL